MPQGLLMGCKMLTGSKKIEIIIQEQNGKEKSYLYDGKEIDFNQFIKFMGKQISFSELGHKKIEINSAWDGIKQIYRSPKQPIAFDDRADGNRYNNRREADCGEVR